MLWVRSHTKCREIIDLETKIVIPYIPFIILVVEYRDPYVRFFERFPTTYTLNHQGPFLHCSIVEKDLRIHVIPFMASQPGPPFNPLYMAYTWG